MTYTLSEESFIAEGIVMEQSAVTQFELPKDVIALVPMRNLVIEPHVLTAITVGRAKSIATLACSAL